MLAAIDPENKLAPAVLVTALLRALGTASAVERQPFTRQSGVAGTVEAAIAILAERGWPARPLRGIFLNESKIQQQPTLFLDVWYDNDWHVFQPNTGKPGLPEHFLVLQRKARVAAESVQAPRAAAAGDPADRGDPQCGRHPDHGNFHAGADRDGVP